MKKRIWLSILLAAILVLCAFALCSCGGKACEHRYHVAVSQKGTCETDKIITYTCALCQHTYDRTIPAAGHNLVYYREKTPTCTEIGWDAYVTCSRCDYTTYEGLILQHTMENGECIVCHTPEGTPGLEYQFNSDSKSYTVTGIGTCTESDIVIGIYNGYSVTSIGEWAFRDCDSLTSITIGNSVTSIGSWAFGYCDSLARVVIPNSVTSIGDDAFAYCYNLTSITVGENNSSYKSIDGNLYTKDGKTLILYAPGKKDTEFEVTNGVESIGSSAFYYCDSLTSVTIGNSVTSIGSSAFHNCTSLTSIVIPDSVTSIGDYAFFNCASLTRVIIGNGVTSIGSYAFCSCTSLTSVVIPDSVISIGSSAFYECTSLTSITVDKNNVSYKSIDGNIYTKDGKTLILYAPGKKDTEFKVPDGVTSIGSYAFYRFTSLTSIVIPDSVTSIGDYVFHDCDSLTSIVIPDSVTSIGEDAFSYCDSLTSVTIPDSVTSIGKYAFAWCYSLTIYCEATSQPSGWHSGWNYSNCPVVWGYKAD